MTDDLQALLQTALDMPAQAAAHQVARHILAKHGQTVRAILFYGSNRRSRQPEGVLDFYVLVDDYRRYHGGIIRILMNWLLPPNVEYLRLENPAAADAENGVAPAIAAKVAVISMTQFARRMRPGAVDTTLWARFSQPASLIYTADAAAREQVIAALCQAVRTACYWGRRRAAAPSAQAFWTGLFALTYGAELRVEQGRPQMIYDHDPVFYDAIFDLQKPAAPGAAPELKAAWAWRRLAGKGLSILRLCKAAFTFEGGVDYLLWKVQRHSGVLVPLRPWQRRHPILAAPALLYRLYRKGIIG